ncbi:hypothetical protein [Arenibacterium sp. LLYu02]|uniref:hypothetical protein n=1 Tax=Arenibacterium sp. LLYu02 TaxID=3404132 RepID=UPI003B222B5B
MPDPSHSAKAKFGKFYGEIKMPNSIAYAMLLVWPVASLFFFKRLPLRRAILLCLIGGYLFLPPKTAFDLPLVPAFDKFTITSIMTMVGCLFIARVPLFETSRSRFITFCMALFILSPIPTVLTNMDEVVFVSTRGADPIIYKTITVPALKLRDLGSVMSSQIIALIPFLIARRHLSTPEAHRDLLIAFCIGGLVYSIPSLIEINIGPELNILLYGFIQHDPEQMVRLGGFRPMVFLPHGLWLALFMSSALIATIAVARTPGQGNRTRYVIAAVYLFVILVLCKSMAALIYGLAFAPLVALAPFRTQIKVALVIGLIGCSYPTLRNAGLFPVTDILAQAEAIDAERAQSLGYRFENEEKLLERAAIKPWFGWGGWGRNLIRDAETRTIETIPDGHWILSFGEFGWVGYLAEMGILTGVLVLLLLGLRRTSAAEMSPYVSAIALILAATMVDMLLNDTLVPITWMCAGAVLGYAERLLYPGSFDPRPALFHGRQVMEGPAQGARLKPLMD